MSEHCRACSAPVDVAAEGVVYRVDEDGRREYYHPPCAPSQGTAYVDGEECPECGESSLVEVGRKTALVKVWRCRSCGANKAEV